MEDTGLGITNGGGVRISFVLRKAHSFGKRHLGQEAYTWAYSEGYDIGASDTKDIASPARVQTRPDWSYWAGYPLMTL